MQLARTQGGWTYRRACRHAVGAGEQRQRRVGEVSEVREWRMATGDSVRLAALADLHCTKTSQGAFQQLFAEVSEAADVVAICGELTDDGLPEEARVLAREITSTVKIPLVAVLGNHDFASDKQEEITQI